MNHAQNNDIDRLEKSMRSNAGMIFSAMSNRVIVFERRFRSTEHVYQYMKTHYYDRKDLAEKIYK